jgi:hypothetical protein
MEAQPKIWVYFQVLYVAVFEKCAAASLSERQNPELFSLLNFLHFQLTGSVF